MNTDTLDRTEVRIDLEYPPNLDGLNTLIQRFGPTIVFHSGEEHLIDDPDAVLNTGKCSLEYALVSNEGDYDRFRQEMLGSIPVDSADSLMSAVVQANKDRMAYDPAFRYWLRMSEDLKRGDPRRAKVLVVAYHRDNPIDPSKGQIFLQFWCFYPFRAPGKFHARMGMLLDDHVEMDTCGRRNGDWERVTLELTYALGAWSLTHISPSRHGQNIWLDSSRIAFRGEHPIIYAAKDSHAYYPTVGTSPYDRAAHTKLKIVTLDVDLYDLTNEGKRLDASLTENYRIISSDFPDHAVKEPAWFPFLGRWGPYEKLRYSYKIDVWLIGYIYAYKEVASGSCGPNTHGVDFVPRASSGIGVTAVEGERPFAFVHGDDGHLRSYRRTAEGWLWNDHGIPPTAALRDPVGVTMVGKRPYVFVQGGGHLWSNSWNGERWVWSDQGKPPTAALKDPVGVTVAEGERPYAFLRGSDGHLWSNWWTGDNWMWSDHGTPPTAALKDPVGVTVVEEKRPYAFLQGSDGHLWSNWWTGENWVWSDQWTPPRAAIQYPVGVATVEKKKPNVFVRGSDGHLWSNCWTGDGWQWSDQGTPPSAALQDPVGTIVQDGKRPHVFVQGSDGHLWSNGWSGNEWLWTDHGGPKSDGKTWAPVGAALADNRPYAFVLDTFGQLWMHWWTGKEWRWDIQSNC